jgi:hypothetical protein
MADHRFFSPSSDPNKPIGTLLGVPVPVNVTIVDIWHPTGNIVWFTRTGKRHEMEWPADGDVMPIIVAMRLSC